MAALELTGKEMAAALGMGYRTFQDLKAPYREVKNKGRTSHLYSLPDVLAAILRASVAASSGKHYDGAVIDMDKERGLKLKAERERIELKNAQLLGEYAPISALGEALDSVISSMVSILDSIAPNIRRSHPEIPTAVIRQIEAAIAHARNNMADAGLNWEQGTAEEDIENG